MENIWKERLDGKMENHGGFEQQNSSGDQEVLRLSDLRCYGHSLVSDARPTSRAGVHPQILLTRLKMIRHEEIGMNLPARLAATSPKVSRNRWQSSSWKIDSRRSPRFMTWYTAPGY